MDCVDVPLLAASGIYHDIGDANVIAVDIKDDRRAAELVCRVALRLTYIGRPATRQWVRRRNADVLFQRRPACKTVLARQRVLRVSELHRLVALLQVLQQALRLTRGSAATVADETALLLSARCPPDGQKESELDERSRQVG